MTGTIEDAGGTAAGTFHATRDELVGNRPLLGSAELARSYCSVADRVVSVVAITTDRIRRVDCWLGGVGFVSHAAANDTTRPLLGSVCDRAGALDLTMSIVGSLVGGLGDAAGTAPIDLDAIAGVAPSAMQDGVDWIVIVSANDADGTSRPERLAVASSHDGLLLGLVRSLDAAVRLDPTLPAGLRDALDGLIGRSPRSVVDLLGDS